MRAVGTIGLLLALGVGCGSGSHAPRDAGPLDGMDAAADADGPVLDASAPPSPAERFLRDYQRRLCGRGVECAYPAWQPEWLWDPPASRCHPALSVWVSQARQYLGGGSITFDGAHADSCLASIPLGEECGLDNYGPLPEGDPPCVRVFRGTVEEGAACVRSAPGQCASGLYCDAPEWGGAGECRSVVPRGEPCSRHEECEGALFEGRCSDGTCTLDRDAGEPCTRSSDCAYPLACIDGTCGEPYAGMPCVAGSCGRELRCIDGVCAEGAAEGEPCGEACAHGTACWGDPAVCTSNDGRDEGDLCALGGYFGHDDTCLGGLVCRVDAVYDRGATGRCVAPQPDGAPCDDTVLCRKGSRCVDGACVGLVPPGEPCGPGAACPLAHACLDGTCRPLPAPGEACAPDVGCLQGRCADGVCCLEAELTSCDPTSASPPLSVCETDCLRDDACDWSPSCDAECAGHTCWRAPDRCAPLC